MKKAFSLMELMLVVILVSIIYMIFLPNLNTVFEQKKNLSLSNLKTQLLEYEFKQSLSFSCIEEEFECFVHIDGELQKELTIKNFFEIRPEVYGYDNSMNRMEFKDLKFDTFEEFPVIFELSFDKEKRHKDMVVETNDGVYVFNSILKEPVKLEYLNDVYAFKEKIATEVKHAF